jgi:hypothetical protein
VLSLPAAWVGGTNYHCSLSQSSNCFYSIQYIITLIFKIQEVYSEINFSDYILINEREWRYFIKARDFAYSLDLRNTEEWLEYCRSEKR